MYITVHVVSHVNNKQTRARESSLISAPKRYPFGDEFTEREGGIAARVSSSSESSSSWLKKNNFYFYLEKEKTIRSSSSTMPILGSSPLLKSLRLGLESRYFDSSESTLAISSLEVAGAAHLDRLSLLNLWRRTHSWANPGRKASSFRRFAVPEVWIQTVIMILVHFQMIDVLSNYWRIIEVWFCYLKKAITFQVWFLLYLERNF